MVKPGSNTSPACTAALRLVGLAEMGEHRAEQEMPDGLIAVGLEAAAHPGGGFRVGIELELGEAENPHPAEGEDVARRQPQRLLDMASVSAARPRILAETDPGVRVGQVPIQRRRPFAFGNALGARGW